jgi:hypothetical protein
MPWDSRVFRRGRMSISVFLLGERAETVLPKIRDWMDDNSWIISEAVIALFIVLMLQNLLG